MISWIKNWYQGKYIPPPKNRPNNHVFFISPGHYEQPLIAKGLSHFFTFWIKNWQFIIGMIVAITLAIFFK